MVSSGKTRQVRKVRLGDHRAFHSRELAAICQYDQRVFDPAAVTGMIGCHPQVVHIDPLHADHRLRIVPTFLPRGLRSSATST